MNTIIIIFLGFFLIDLLLDVQFLIRILNTVKEYKKFHPEEWE